MLYDILPLMVIFILAIISKNTTTSIAILILLFIRVIMQDKGSILSFIENKFILLGVICFTMAVLSPLAAGKIGFPAIIESFKHPTTIIAICMSIFVSWTAAQSIPLMKSSPEIVTALAIGTIIGISLFKGLATGPLISAGLVALVLEIGKKV